MNPRLAAGAVAATLMLQAGLAGPATAGGSPPPDGVHGGPTASSVEMALDRQSFVVGPTGVFAADVSISDLPEGAQQPPPEPPDPGREPGQDPDGAQPEPAAAGPAPDVMEVVVTVHERLRTRSAFARSVTGALGRVVYLAGPDPLVGSGPTATHQVRIPVSEEAVGADGLRLTRSGVYPVHIVLRRQDLTTVAEMVTHLVRVPGPADDSSPLDVASVVPIHHAPAFQPDDTVAMPGAGAVLDVIDAITAPSVAQVPIDLRATPETLAALGRVADPAGATTDPPVRDLDPDEVAAALDTLRTTLEGRNVAPGPLVDLDLGSWERAGRGTQLDRLIEHGNATLALVLSKQPSPRVWIAGALSSPALVTLHRHGYDAVVVAEEDLVAIDRSLTLTRPFVLRAPQDAPTSARPLPAVMADSALSAAFPSPGEDGTLAAHHVLADLAVLFFDQPGQRRGAVVMPPADWSPDARFLSTYLTGLRDHPLLSPVTVPDLFRHIEPATDGGGEPLERTLRDEGTSGIGFLADALPEGEALLDAFGSMLTIGDDRADRLRTLLRIAASDDLDVGGRLAYLDAVRSTVNAELEAIRAPSGQNVTLTASEGSVPLTFQNTGSTPMRVKICLDNQRLDFPQGPCRDVTLSELNTTQRFPVRSRAAGTYPVEITVSSPDGQLVLATARVTVRSTAFSGVGLVLTVGAGAFLVLWWGTHWRRTRRTRAAVLRTGADP